EAKPISTLTGTPALKSGPLIKVSLGSLNTSEHWLKRSTSRSTSTRVRRASLSSASFFPSTLTLQSGIRRCASALATITPAPAAHERAGAPETKLSLPDPDGLRPGVRPPAGSRRERESAADV